MTQGDKHFIKLLCLEGKHITYDLPSESTYPLYIPVSEKGVKS